jgi:hypothetical protein
VINIGKVQIGGLVGRDVLGTAQRVFSFVLFPPFLHFVAITIQFITKSNPPEKSVNLKR